MKIDYCQPAMKYNRLFERKQRNMLLLVVNAL
jgi:hypothetical protein